MYGIKIVQNDEWEKFVLNQLYTIFVQSPAYGEFYNRVEEEYWIFGMSQKSLYLKTLCSIAYNSSWLIG